VFPRDIEDFGAMGSSLIKEHQSMRQPTHVDGKIDLNVRGSVSGVTSLSVLWQLGQQPEHYTLSAATCVQQGARCVVWVASFR
jgi:hypothetical protein